MPSAKTLSEPWISPGNLCSITFVNFPQIEPKKAQGKKCSQLVKTQKHLDDLQNIYPKVTSMKKTQNIQSRSQKFIFSSHRKVLQSQQHLIIDHWNNPEMMFPSPGRLEVTEKKEGPAVAQMGWSRRQRAASSKNMDKKGLKSHVYYQTAVWS